MNEINISEDEKEVIEIIKKYLLNRIDYPQSYKDLFFSWSLINPLYNECGKGIKEEYLRIAKFGKKYNCLWNNKIEQKSIALIKEECVGKGRYIELDKHVLSATRYLRNEFEINSNICVNCRKEVNCNKTEKVVHTSGKLGAIMRIIYQIRSNLFHGDKNELSGPVGERNERYVNLANKIMKEILNSIDLSF